MVGFNDDAFTTGLVKSNRLKISKYSKHNIYLLASIYVLKQIDSKKGIQNK